MADAGVNWRVLAVPAVGPSLPPPKATGWWAKVTPCRTRHARSASGSWNPLHSPHSLLVLRARLLALPEAALAAPAIGSTYFHLQYPRFQQLEKFPQQTEPAAWSGASGGIPEHNKILFFQGEGELNTILYFLVEPELNRNLVRSGYRNSTGTYRNLPSTGTYQSSGTLPPRDELCRHEEQTRRPSWGGWSHHCLRYAPGRRGLLP